MTFREYRSAPGINISRLKGFAISPAHAMQEKPDSESLALGRAAHCAILEPDAFESRFLVVPKVSRSTKEGKALWADAQIRAQGREIITDADMELVKGMKAAVFASETARAALIGEKEVPAFWNLEGQPCKGLYDNWNREACFITDLKTTKSAHPAKFQRDAFRSPLLYHWQGAWYTDGAEIITGQPHTFFIVAVESGKNDKGDPRVHGVSVHVLEPDAIEQGREEYKKALADYQQCIKAGKFPAYPDALFKMAAPKWKDLTPNMEDDFDE